ncbi:MAG: hypothetical protein FWH27_11810 [Planctomycetaceae bacterium]|nr:hypothetical protein [Planctomycetaceae bacterium]
MTEESGGNKGGRLLYFALAMLMCNCWIWFERVCVTENGRRQQTRDGSISFRDLLLRLDQSFEIDLTKPDRTR